MIRRRGRLPRHRLGTVVVALVLSLAGGVALAAGIALVATAPSGHATVGWVRVGPDVGTGGAGVAAGGEF